MNRLRTTLLGSFAVLLTPGFAALAAQPIDFTSCRAGTFSVLAQTDDLMLMAIEHRGIDQSTQEDGLFDNYTHKCNGVMEYRGKMSSGTGYCKYLAPDGDFVTIRWANSGERSEGTWEFLSGTGKWQGVKGKGTYQNSAKGKGIEAGTYQNCIHVTGTAEFPQ